MNNHFTQIGWFNLPEDKVYQNTFECAAWCENVLVKAGRYPVEVYDLAWEKDGRISFSCHGVYVQMHGTIVSDYFPALYCGVPVSDRPYDEKKNAGKETEVHDYLYTYMVTEEDGFELFPEYEIRASEYIAFDGEKRKTHDIYRRADK